METRSTAGLRDGHVAPRGRLRARARDGARGRRSESPATEARQDARDDRTMFFVARLPGGTHTFRHTLRATHVGAFTALARHGGAHVLPRRAGELVRRAVAGHARRPRRRREVIVHRLLVLLAAWALIVVGVRPGARPRSPAPSRAVRITSPRGGQTRARVIRIAGTLAGRRGRAPHARAERRAALHPPQRRHLRDAAGAGARTQHDPRPRRGDGRASWPTRSRSTRSSRRRICASRSRGTRPAPTSTCGSRGRTARRSTTSTSKGRPEGRSTRTSPRATGPRRTRRHASSRAPTACRRTTTGAAQPTRVTVTVIRGEGTPQEERRVFRDVLLATNDVVGGRRVRLAR